MGSVFSLAQIQFYPDTKISVFDDHEKFQIEELKSKSKSESKQTQNIHLPREGCKYVGYYPLDNSSCLSCNDINDADCRCRLYVQTIDDKEVGEVYHSQPGDIKWCLCNEYIEWFDSVRRCNTCK